MKCGKKRHENLYIFSFLSIGTFLMVMCSNKLELPENTGILIISHGDRLEGWNQSVHELIAPFKEKYFLESAFLYPVPGESLQEGIDKLEERGAETILVVTLLISSYSEHFEELEYVLGLRNKVTSHTFEHPPVDVKARIVLGRAINSNPIIAKIIEKRAENLSVDPSSESLVLIGHGPNSEEYNKEWLYHLDKIGESINNKVGFRQIYSRTLRDDAPPEIRDEATRQLRLIIEQESRTGTVLIIPLLIAYSEVQDGIRKRIEGLKYSMDDKGLVQDPLLSRWLEEEIQRLIREQHDMK